MMVITSVNNKIVKEILKLKKKKYRDLENLFLVETRHLVMEAYKMELLEKVIVLEGQSDLEFEGVSKITVSSNVMDKIKETDSVCEVIGVVRKKKSLEIGKRIIILDRIQDPGNLGTIIRSAVAFSFDNVIVSEDTVDLYNPKVVRATQGMMFKIEVGVRKIEDLIEELKAFGYTIYTTDVKGGMKVHEVDFEEKIAIVVGNEGQGVREKVSDLCSKKLYINMSDRCESLNVGVASSIIMYEVSKK